MSSLGENLFGMIKSLNDKIDWLMQHYAPTNLNVAGNTTLGNNTTIGEDDSDLLTINAQTTFNNGLTSNSITTDDLIVKDDTTIGQDNCDSLTVNSNATFNNDALFKNEVTFENNVVLGSDETNLVVSTGTIESKHFTVPTVSDNSIRLGSSDIIIYHEYTSTDTSANIYTEFPYGVVVQIKNLNEDGLSMSITYDSMDTFTSVAYNTTAVFLKTSTGGYTMIQSFA